MLPPLHQVHRRRAGPDLGAGRAASRATGPGAHPGSGARARRPEAGRHCLPPSETGAPCTAPMTPATRSAASASARPADRPRGDRCRARPVRAARRRGRTPAHRSLVAWLECLRLPPAAYGAGPIGALAFGEEYRDLVSVAALTAARGTVPRRPALFLAKLGAAPRPPWSSRVSCRLSAFTRCASRTGRTSRRCPAIGPRRWPVGEGSVSAVTGPPCRPPAPSGSWRPASPRCPPRRFRPHRFGSCRSCTRRSSYRRPARSQGSMAGSLNWPGPRFRSRGIAGCPPRDGCSRNPWVPRCCCR